MSIIHDDCWRICHNLLCHDRGLGFTLCRFHLVVAGMMFVGVIQGISNLRTGRSRHAFGSRKHLRSTLCRQHRYGIEMGFHQSVHSIGTCPEDREALTVGRFGKILCALWCLHLACIYLRPCISIEIVSRFKIGGMRCGDGYNNWLFTLENVHLVATDLWLGRGIDIHPLDRLTRRIQGGRPALRNFENDVFCAPSVGNSFECPRPKVASSNSNLCRVSYSHVNVAVFTQQPR
mmetsp:Transcript_17124/g.24917  ORF Transcript_17124/g.24917 Transcript_17124/m.24917 type:complete len:233 (-) Transcript_17124:93-791(-)